MTVVSEIDEDITARELLQELQNQTDLYLHSLRVASLSVEIAKTMQLSWKEQEAVRAASLFHDVGKLYLTKDLLQKPDLSSAEWELIKAHSEVGKLMLDQTSSLKQYSDWVLCHHERFDGSGYPLGLRGGEIPVVSRIMAVADSLDAMLSFRPYRARTFSLTEAIYEISNLGGMKYDYAVTSALSDICKQYMPRLLMCFIS